MSFVLWKKAGVNKSEGNKRSHQTWFQTDKGYNADILPDTTGQIQAIRQQGAFCESPENARKSIKPYLDTGKGRVEGFV